LVSSTEVLKSTRDEEVPILRGGQRRNGGAVMRREIVTQLLFWAVVVVLGVLIWKLFS